MTLPGSGMIRDFFMTGFENNGIVLDETNLLEQTEEMCADPNFQAFLEEEKYTLHVCDEFRLAQNTMIYCSAFNKFLPAAFEVWNVIIHLPTLLILYSFCLSMKTNLSIHCVVSACALYIYEIT